MAITMSAACPISGGGKPVNRTMRSAWRVVLILGVASCSSSGSQLGSTSNSSRPLTRASSAPVKVAGTEARFEDVSAAAGIQYEPDARHLGDDCLLSPKRLEREFPDAKFSFNASMQKTQCIPERMTGGVAVGDYNNDDWPDVYITRIDNSGVLFRNAGDGTFTDVTATAGLDVLHEAGSGAAFADLDNDGHAELVVTTVGGHRSYLFHNQGNGAFSEEAIQRGVAQDDGNVHSSYSVNVGDYDNDGYIDLHVSEWRLPELATNLAASHNQLLRNRGAEQPGYFEDVTKQAGVALETNGFGVVGFASTLTDLDGDGNLDLVAVNDFSTGRLFWNNGDGSFTDGTKSSGFATEENGMGLAVGDFDGDGRPDLFVSSIYDPVQCPVGQCVHGTSGNRLYRNLGDRKFADVTETAGVRDGGWGWGAAWIDSVNRGRIDLVMTSGVDFPWEETSKQYLNGPNYFWRNAGESRFASDSATEAGLHRPGPGKGLATLDFDRDGRRDLIIVRDGATAVLYRNVAQDSGAWIGVKLVGSVSNRDGVGAVIRLVTTTGAAAISAHYGSGSEFLGSSERVATIGLGDHDGPVTEIAVSWPSGRITKLRNVAANTYITIAEGG